MSSDFKKKKIDVYFAKRVGKGQRIEFPPMPNGLDERKRRSDRERSLDRLQRSGGKRILYAEEV